MIDTRATSDAAAGDLHTAARLYRGVHGLILDVPGRPRAGGRSGKPRSTPPPGVDHPLRAALVTAARAVAYGHHLAAGMAAPGDWWLPHPDTGQTAQLGVWVLPLYGWLEVTVAADPDGGGEVLRVDSRPERPVWTPDPTDPSVTVPSPGRFEWACDRLAAGAAWAASYGLDTGPLARQAGRAVGRLRHVEKVRRLDVNPDEPQAATLLGDVLACQDCRSGPVCRAHTVRLQAAHGRGWLIVRETWRGAEPPVDYPTVAERCGHWPGCWRLRDGRHRLCQPCRKRGAGDCGRCREAAAEAEAEAEAEDRRSA